MNREQERILRKEVCDIITTHMSNLFVKGSPINVIELSDCLLDDIMGALRTRENNNLKDYMNEIDIQREEILKSHKVEIAQNNETIFNLQQALNHAEERIVRLQNEISSDEVKMELERNIAIRNKKIATLKKLVQACLEDI